MTPTYNETYATVLVYIGKDRARLDTWHKQAEAEGLTVGKWLAKLADEATGYGQSEATS